MSQGQQEGRSGEDSVNINLPAGQEAPTGLPDQGGAQADSSSGYKYGIFKQRIRYDPISIVFAILIFIGGLIGYLTKQSTPSLVAGTIFALLIGIFTYVDGVRR